MDSAFAVYRPLHVVSSSLASRRLQSIVNKVEYSQELRVTVVTQIVRKCVLVEVEKQFYVVTIPNVVETD